MPSRCARRSRLSSWIGFGSVIAVVNALSSGFLDWFNWRLDEHARQGWRHRRFPRTEPQRAAPRSTRRARAGKAADGTRPRPARAAAAWRAPAAAYRPGETHQLEHRAKARN